jgi:hypothetical protein
MNRIDSIPRRARADDIKTARFGQPPHALVERPRATANLVQTDPAVREKILRKI